MEEANGEAQPYMSPLALSHLALSIDADVQGVRLAARAIDDRW